jgi:2,4'-dihydroxyacetophenone dioxygenase
MEQITAPTGPQPVKRSPGVNPDRVPWMPGTEEGLEIKPLCFFRHDRGRALLLRLQPGFVIPRHRHTGEVHGYNLQGTRKLLDTGEVIGPGGYVYEPPGNNDSWMAVGDEPLIVHVVVHGAVEYLDDNGEVLQRDDTASLRQAYERYCAANGIEVVDLVR